ncbi:MAG: amino acid permease [Planctomycetota bacterium]|nr:MAG: amino acid permease [Planctomycetota bacterium]
MSWSQLFRRKSIESLVAEMHAEKRLHRVLGPVSLTSLGVGAIIGAGIFAMTGRVAAQDAGPAVMLSFVVAGIACALAALCYSEFAAMVPVAGSAYTYTYATLGELAAWIIGWDLILEYSMSCATVAAAWTHYFNEFLIVTVDWQLPLQITADPFTDVKLATGEVIQTWVNLPAMLIIGLVTYILVIGIRESAVTNTILVIVKLAVVLLVIGLGIGYIHSDNYTTIPVENRNYSVAGDFVKKHPEIARTLPSGTMTPYTSGENLLDQFPEQFQSLNAAERATLKDLKSDDSKIGMIGVLGLKDKMESIDNHFRSPFMPYGLSGIMVGAALVFFAYIGFDSISTHSEEAINPQRDVPLGILVSLTLCTVLYILVSAVITGMEPYHQIDTKAAIASAFRKQAVLDQSRLLKFATALISTGALAGMTSVLLVTFLSQARVFLAMARDGLLPKSIFSVVHEKYRTPHRSTILTGVFIMLAAGFMPMDMLGEMVSIGTLMAFALVCASVLLLRIRRPEIARPFRCPAVWIVAPLGVLANILMMLFLPMGTWVRLFVWLALGMVFYFSYGARHSSLQASHNNPSA